MKIKFKNLILLLLLMLILSEYTTIYAQTNETLMYKYWTYKQRFLGDWLNRDENPGFINEGVGNGRSTPVVIRDKYKPNWFWEWDYYRPNNIKKDGCYIEGVSYHKPDGSLNPLLKGSLQFGDGTIAHGFYLATLALEWELLNRNGQNTEDTEIELLYALYAINRLDANAETLYPDENHPGNNLPPDINGFFIRSDGNTELSQYFGKNYNIVASGITMKDFNNECDPGSSPSHIVKEAESQDQVIALLFGLRFVKKFVSGNEHYHPLIGVDVEKITNRIIKRVQGNNIFGGDWIIDDPYGDHVCRGPAAICFSWPIAKTGKIITDKNYQNLNSLSIGAPIWNLIKSGLHLSPGNWIDLSSILLPLFPHANYGWNAREWGYNLNMILKLMVMTSNNIDHNDISINSYLTHKDIYDLAFAALHDCQPKGPGRYSSLGYFEAYYSYEELKTYWENQILGTAPCEGPCFDTKSGIWDSSHCEPVDGWWSDDRWSKIDHPNIKNGTDNFGEYNGLDYMLAYNLYRYIFNPYGYIKMGGVFCQSWSVTKSPNTIVSPNKISSKTTIQANGTENVKYVAGKEIDLYPGFNTEDNAFFEAYIESSMQCEQNKGDAVSEFKIYNLIPYSILKEDSINIDNISSNDLINEYNSFEIYPNPCKDKINIFFIGDETKKYEIRIYNMIGELIWEKQNINYPFSAFDISNINNSGIYIIKLLSNNIELTKKIVIQK